jgi:competence protein ComEA
VAKPVKEVQKETKSAAKSASAAVQGAKVNINTADKAALDVLPGIGPVKAQAIIDGRPYKTIEDVMKVSGIKEKAFEKIKDMITVR